MDDNLQMLFNGLVVMGLGYLLIYGVSRLEALRILEKTPCSPHAWTEGEAGDLFCKNCFVRAPRMQPVKFKDKESKQ